MLQRFDDLARSDLIVVAVGVLMALATFELVRAFVESLVMPVILLFFGESEFPFLSFSIGGTEFVYGPLLSSAVGFILVCLLVNPLWKAHRKYDGLSGTRDCPECVTPIPIAAKRCPECTAVVTPDTA